MIKRHRRVNRNIPKNIVLYSRLGEYPTALFMSRREAMRVIRDFKENGNWFEIPAPGIGVGETRVIYADKVLLAKVASPVYYMHHNFAKKRLLSSVYQRERR